MRTELYKTLLGNLLKRYRNRFSCTFASPGYVFILIQKKIPDEGWPDSRIEMLLGELSMMDSNNFPGKLMWLHAWAST